MTSDPGLRDSLPPLHLLLSRFSILHAADRIRLHDVLDGSRELVSLSRASLERLCARKLSSDHWNPELWLELARTDHTALSRLGIQALHYFDRSYPPALRETARPPYVLYVRGSVAALSLPALAMVGTRFPTGEGLQFSARLSAEAARSGLVVVSGLARGIDSASHRGALSAHGLSVAVLGCGIDQVYPRSNRELASRLVVSGGCLVSEYPIGVNPARWTFPERNRIIAGLCRSTLVVEAPEKSGALITAGFALEEGRDVFVSDFSVRSPRGRGCAQLAVDGAIKVNNFSDIVRDWHPYSGCSSAREAQPPYGRERTAAFVNQSLANYGIVPFSRRRRGRIARSHRSIKHVN